MQERKWLSRLRASPVRPPGVSIRHSSVTRTTASRIDARRKRHPCRRESHRSGDRPSPVRPQVAPIRPSSVTRTTASRTDTTIDHHPYVRESYRYDYRPSPVRPRVASIREASVTRTTARGIGDARAGIGDARAEMGDARAGMGPSDRRSGQTAPAAHPRYERPLLTARLSPEGYRSHDGRSGRPRSPPRCSEAVRREP
jgi:hypothetical protein